MTWLEFYCRSALYPFELPAIRGPSFFRRISSAQRRLLLEDGGVQGVWARYAFLLQVHEETHLMQSGEPLLCEFGLACAWCRFLDESGHWSWQQNIETGASFNREREFVRSVSLSKDALSSLYVAPESALTPESYRVALDLAWRFDCRQMSYSAYLGRLVRLLNLRET